MKKLLVLMVIAIVSFLLVKCGNNNSQNKNITADNTSSVLSDTAIYNKYLGTGSKYAAQTGAVLIKNVTDAIKKEGTEYAIGFCNTQAIPLTHSMAGVQNVSIKRVTDKARNPLNKANEDELKYIQQLKSLVTSGEKPKPQLQEIDGRIVGYYPIITNDMCMQCHGDKPGIDAKTLAKLNQLYPADAATGYKPNQLRGLWVVQMMMDQISVQRSL